MAEGDLEEREEEKSSTGGADDRDSLRKKKAAVDLSFLGKVVEEDKPVTAVEPSEGVDSRGDEATENGKWYGRKAGSGGVDDGYDADGDWEGFGDNEIMEQHTSIREEEAFKFPLVGDKEPLLALDAEYQSGSHILLEKIKHLGEQYSGLRRTRGDGNCFFRSFMFSYLEHILETQDKAEVEHITAKVEQCKKTLQKLGYADFTFEDFFSAFIGQLEDVSREENSISHEELLQRSRDQSISDYIVMFFRFVTSGEIRKRTDFFAPFILGLSNKSVDQFCKTSVEPMNEESDHVHITALSDALGVPIRVVYLDRSSNESGPQSVNHHDFIPTSDMIEKNQSEKEPSKPFITLLYRPGHYDILYAK